MRTTKQPSRRPIHLAQILIRQSSRRDNLPAASALHSWAVANGLLALYGGVVSAGTQSFNVASRTDTAFSSVQTFQDFRFGNHSAYAQDSWRVRPNFTLTFGLRYELFTALKLNNGIGFEPEIPSGSNVRQAILNPAGRLVLVGTNFNNPGQYYKTDKNNFTPVLSFSWSPKASNKLGKFLVGDGRTVFRAGYRWSYLNDQMITVLNNAGHWK